MGRELRRVPIDFDWPLKKTWDGYLNPHFRSCPEEGRTCFAGSSAVSMWVDSIARLIALIGSQAIEEPRAEVLRERGQVFPHPWLREWSQAPTVDLPHEERERIHSLPNQADRMRAIHDFYSEREHCLVPFSPVMVDFVRGLSGEEPRPSPFGGFDAWPIVKMLRAASGLPESAWKCTVCQGEGLDPDVREIYESWEPTEPPEGDGFQLWETTSEGSPVSPVFETLDALCEWCAENATTFADFKATKERWREMLDENFVRHEVSGTGEDGAPVHITLL